VAPRNSLFAEATEKRSLVEIAVKKDLSSLDSDGTSRKLGAALPTERFTLGFGITVALLEVRFIMKSCGHVNTKAIFIQHHHHCSLTPEFSDAFFPPSTNVEIENSLDQSARNLLIFIGIFIFLCGLRPL
jgi:hypothetical protein